MSDPWATTTIGAELTGSAFERLTIAAIAGAGLASREDADQRIGDVLIVAEEWYAGQLPLAQVRLLTSPQERFLAMRFTRPVPAALRAVIDALIDSTEDPRYGWLYRTPGGILSEALIASAGGVHGRTETGFVIRFPASVPRETSNEQAPRRWK